MKHIRILSLALLLCLIALPASAQGRASAPREPHGREARDFSVDRPSRRSGSTVTQDELLSAMETMLSGLCERGVITEDDLTTILSELSGKDAVAEDADSTDETGEQSDEPASESHTTPVRRGRSRPVPGSASTTVTASETEADGAEQSENGLDSSTLLALVENGMLTQQEYETLVSD